MSDAQESAARLRRTFAGNDGHDDDDNDSLPEAMDEQEQEEFIARLAQDNASKNESTRRILVLLPLASTIPYFSALMNPWYRFYAILALTSLLSTAFLISRLPPTRSGISWLDARWSGGAAANNGSDSSALASQVTAPGGPLAKYLPTLNLILALSLAIMCAVTQVGKGQRLQWMVLGNLPIVVYILVLFVKRVMAGVDPERELSSLKYGYRGA